MRQVRRNLKRCFSFLSEMVTSCLPGGGINNEVECPAQGILCNYMKAAFITLFAEEHPRSMTSYFVVPTLF